MVCLLVIQINIQAVCNMFLIWNKKNPDIFGQSLEIQIIVLFGASSSVLSFSVVCWVEIQNYSIWYTSRVLSQFYSVPCLELIAYSSSIMLMYTILDVHKSFFEFTRISFVSSLEFLNAEVWSSKIVNCPYKFACKNLLFHFHSPPVALLLLDDLTNYK